MYGGRIGPARALDELRPQGLAASIVSHGELFEGAFGYSDTDARLALIYGLLSRFETLPLNDPIMEIVGRNRSNLRRTGRRIPDLDLLIGATAVHHDLILITRNVKHFDRISGIRLYQPN
ncbi:MAG: type II toxin-antitoxin system VapC family toxin [Thermomicrobiales bacterium]